MDVTFDAIAAGGKTSRRTLGLNTFVEFWFGLIMK